MESVAVLRAHVHPIHQCIGQDIKFFWISCSHLIHHPETVGEQIKCTWRSSLHQAVQQIDTGLILVVRQIGVHLQWRRQIRNVAGALLVSYNELFAVVSASNKSDAVGQATASSFLERRVLYQCHSVDR